MATPDPPAQPGSQQQSASEPQPQPQPQPTPGPRAQRLIDLYAQTLRHTLSKLAWEHISTCYPTIATRAEPVLRQVQSQMVSKLSDKCGREFDSIIANRGVVAGLNELEGLIREAGRRKGEGEEESQTPPHLLPPSQILSAHLSPALTSHRSQLNARLQTTQSQNTQLLEEVTSQRKEIEELLSRLEATAGDIRGANEALGPLVEDLAREAREGKAAIEAVGDKGTTSNQEG